MAPTLGRLTSEVYEQDLVSRPLPCTQGVFSFPSFLNDSLNTLRTCAAISRASRKRERRSTRRASRRWQGVKPVPQLAGTGKTDGDGKRRAVFLRSATTRRLLLIASALSFS